MQVRWGPRATAAERTTTVLLILVGLLIIALALGKLEETEFLFAFWLGALGASMIWAAARGIQLTRRIPVDDEGYPIDTEDPPAT